MRITGYPPLVSSFDRQIYCETAERLLALFGESVQCLVRLHEQQFLTVLHGGEDAGRFEILMNQANERKLNAKYAYLTHLQLHGCSCQVQTKSA
jgi:hypothetical protein